MTFVTNRKQSLFSVCLVTFLFLATSYPAGGDWIGYFVNYDCVINDQCGDGLVLFEPGYQMLVRTFGVLGFQSITIAIAIINMFLLMFFCRNFSNGAFIFFAIMCIFLWTLYVETIRQSLAMGLLLVGFSLLLYKKVKTYISIVLVASLFHFTAFVGLLFVVPFFSIRLGRLLGYCLIVLGGVFFFLSASLLSIVLDLFPPDSLIYQKLSFYLSSEQYMPQLSVGAGTVLDVLLIAILVISFYRARESKAYRDNVYATVIFLGVCVYVSFGILIGKMMPVMTRIGWMGFPFVLILIFSNIGSSNFMNKNSSPMGRPIITLMIYSYFILQILRPFAYDLSRYNILRQETIFQNISRLDDSSMRSAARQKCKTLTTLGYGYLCTI